MIQTLMPIIRKTPEAVSIYWMLARIMVPITLFAELLSRLGVIEAIAPWFDPVMGLIGLPAELGLAWITALIVGLWGAVPLLFTLVPVSSLSVGEVTIFSALILFAHALPIEQKIIQKAGPGFLVTTLLRLLGGLLYAFILHQILSATGWLSQPVNPVWIPLSTTPDWFTFLIGFAEAMAWMFVILVGLFWGLELLKVTGILDRMMMALSPFLRLAGIKGEASHLTAVGLFLGISYGAGLLIREAQSGAVSPRQIFLSCVFMGFAHSVIEDTLLMMALGADAIAILVGRVIFAILATRLIAVLIRNISEKAFHIHLFQSKAIRADAQQSQELLG